MKRLALIGFLGAIAIACVLIHKDAEFSKYRDNAFQLHLVGVWSREEDNLPHGVGKPLSMRCTNTVAADGSFVELSWFRHPDRTNTFRRTGTWLVKNGNLIETVKTSTNPTEVTPHSEAGRIFIAGALGSTLRWQHSTNETIWQRVTK
jgi:hypothetical protein